MCVTWNICIVYIIDMIEQHIWIGWNESSHRQMKSTISFKKCWWECSSWSRKVRVRRWHGSFGPKRSGPKNRQDNDTVVKTTRHRMVHKKIRQRESWRRKTCTIVQALRMNLCQNIGHRLFHWWIIKPTSTESPRKPFKQNDWRKLFFSPTKFPKSHRNVMRDTRTKQNWWKPFLNCSKILVFIKLLGCRRASKTLFFVADLKQVSLLVGVKFTNVSDFDLMV